MASNIPPQIALDPLNASTSNTIAADQNEFSDDLSDEAETIMAPHISDEDAQSIIGVSLSHAASRLKSSKTPAAEKAAAMDNLEGGYFDSDPETPTLEPTTKLPFDEESRNTKGEEPTLGKLPSPKLSPKLDAAVKPPPPQSRAESKSTVVIEPPNEARTSAMASVFHPGRKRQSSLSSGADALKKLLPKGLPSMSQVGNLFGTSTSSNHKSRSSFHAPRNATFHSFSLSPSRSKDEGSSSTNNRQVKEHLPAQSRSSQRHSNSHLQNELVAGNNSSAERPRTIRRTTSDDSLLYHSLSRTSSLGDDSRFENHREQVNSRVKAIRDSFQDRSTFRMPQLPSMPNILPVVTKKKPLEPSPSFSKYDSFGKDNTRSSTKPANALDKAMENLTGDVVIMGGYRGSILRSAKAPNHQLWVPVKVGLNIRKVDLEVGLNPEDEERMEESIIPSGMLKNIGPVDISRRLFKRLKSCENAQNGKLRVWDYGYDWRLSPHLLSRKLKAFLEKLPSNRPGPNGEKPTGALVIAHSLGGLITRHVVNQKPELFSGVIYAGVPHSCVNILGPFRNGDAVLLSSRVLTAQVNFTLRTSFLLLPENGECFFDLHTREKYPVDFFNLDDWIKYRWSPVTDPPLPPISQSGSGIGGILNLQLPNSLSSLTITGKKPLSGSNSGSGSGSGSNTPQPSSPYLGSNSRSENDNRNQSIDQSKTSRAAEVLRGVDGTDRTLAPQMSNSLNKSYNPSPSVSTLVTLPRDKAIEYLRRTLAETLQFKKELHFKPEISDANRYPPLAVIYGKSIPTVYGAKVAGREGIPCADVYDNLAFASGDGVCLAREAMLPEGYQLVRGGKVRSDRGHVTLLGDLNAVGRAMEAIRKGRGKGIGFGV
ncbi:3be45c2a-55f7-40e6-99b4-c11ec8b366e8 [Sclerotinia trifoliorum]|uniref:3be45c2a-55f7-40e6-99b4-c11ec8b366e8 n=1 Tax=Sclerotinia trifoliorum TaxID=28548 RepID=A0A8H2ZLV7_9HELO|nr:3be45c2a-55f7-40e6-99b4-c11ec8b366e8 [Sclerotinia trifoliorum]